MAKDPLEILRNRDAELAKIRGYVDLTEEAKNRRIAEVQQKASAEYQAAITQRDQEVQERLQKAEKAVFRIPIPYGATDVEKAQLRALQRSAYLDVHDRTAAFFEADDHEASRHAQERLEDLLAYADRTGDAELARGVYHVATLRGVREVAESYLKTRPEEKRHWDEYATARAEAEHPQSVEGLLDRAFTNSVFAASGA